MTPEREALQLVRDHSILGELEKRLCTELGLTAQDQHNLFYVNDLDEEIDQDNANQITAGSVNLAKEYLHRPGTQIDMIARTVELFYNNEGFKTILERTKENHQPVKGFVAPEGYFQSVSFAIKSENKDEQYAISIYQGDHYSVSISKLFPQTIED